MDTIEYGYTRLRYLGYGTAATSLFEGTEQELATYVKQIAKQGTRVLRKQAKTSVAQDWKTGQGSVVRGWILTLEWSPMVADAKSRLK